MENSIPKRVLGLNNSSANSLATENVQLSITIDRLLTRNKEIHSHLLESNPNISYDLYIPKIQKGLSELLQKELKLKQIDRLLDEQSKLTQKCEEVKFKDEESRERKLREIQSSSFNYREIMNLWEKMS